jgi:hypothetical protein
LAAQTGEFDVGIGAVKVCDSKVWYQPRCPDP